MNTKKSINWDSQPLGVVSDHEIARQLDAPLSTVRYARVVRNIHAYTKSLNKGTNWDSKPLGEMSDSELSRQLGVSKETVRRARVRRSIHVHREPCSICGTPIIPLVKTPFNVCSLCYRYANSGTVLSDMDNLSISEKKARLLANITPERLEKYRAKRRKDNE